MFSAGPMTGFATLPLGSFALSHGGLAMRTPIKALPDVLVAAPASFSAYIFRGTSPPPFGFLRGDILGSVTSLLLTATTPQIGYPCQLNCRLGKRDAWEKQNNWEDSYVKPVTIDLHSGVSASYIFPYECSSLLKFLGRNLPI
jgi:hypothetical protein